MIRNYSPFVFVALAVLLGACDGTAESDHPEGGRDFDSGVEIAVAPLELEDVTNAVYAVTVQNSLGELIVGTTIDSQRYGDGAGSALYIAPCDADPAAQPNTVTVTLLQLFNVSTPIAVEALPQLTREVVCAPNQDTLVQFDLTVVRSAQQGFFDIKVSYADIFCSAKLDCVDDFIDGVNVTTAVVGFACTAGRGLAETSLYMSDINISCSTESVSVNPDGDGRLPSSQIQYKFNLWPGLIKEATVYRGAESFSEVDKLYWNVALGLVDAGDTHNCTLHARATATEVQLSGPPYTLDDDYPYVDWFVPLTNSTGGVVCGRHPLGGPGGYVAVEYSSNVTSVDLDHAFGGP